MFQPNGLSIEMVTTLIAIVMTVVRPGNNSPKMRTCNFYMSSFIVSHFMFDIPRFIYHMIKIVSCKVCPNLGRLNDMWLCGHRN